MIRATVRLVMDLECGVDELDETVDTLLKQAGMFGDNEVIGHEVIEPEPLDEGE